MAVGCDGTNSNTNANGGLIRLLEELLGRPMQWLVCLQHRNELPLKHLIQKLDGRTQGPTSSDLSLIKSFIPVKIFRLKNISPVSLKIGCRS